MARKTVRDVNEGIKELLSILNFSSVTLRGTYTKAELHVTCHRHITKEDFPTNSENKKKLQYNIKNMWIPQYLSGRYRRRLPTVLTPFDRAFSLSVHSLFAVSKSFMSNSWEKLSSNSWFPSDLAKRTNAKLKEATYKIIFRDSIELSWKWVLYLDSRSHTCGPHLYDPLTLGPDLWGMSKLVPLNT